MADALLVLEVEYGVEVGRSPLARGARGVAVRGVARSVNVGRPRMRGRGTTLPCCLGTCTAHPRNSDWRTQKTREQEPPAGSFHHRWVPSEDARAHPPHISTPDSRLRGCGEWCPPSSVLPSSAGSLLHRSCPSAHDARQTLQTTGSAWAPTFAPSPLPPPACAGDLAFDPAASPALHARETHTMEGAMTRMRTTHAQAGRTYGHHPNPHPPSRRHARLRRGGCGERGIRDGGRKGCGEGRGRAPSPLLPPRLAAPLRRDNVRAFSNSSKYSFVDRWTEGHTSVHHLRREHGVRGTGRESEAVHGKDERMMYESRESSMYAWAWASSTTTAGSVVQVLTGTAHQTLRTYSAKSAPRKTVRRAEGEGVGVILGGASVVPGRASSPSPTSDPGFEARPEPDPPSGLTRAWVGLRFLQARDPGLSPGLRIFLGKFMAWLYTSLPTRMVLDFARGWASTDHVEKYLRERPHDNIHRGLFHPCRALATNPEEKDSSECEEKMDGSGIWDNFLEDAPDEGEDDADLGFGLQ
ncbi:hypothetical protein K438DRAFT_2075600 [Mycena galopus ATCC 62051]|nr:hypothetical protein K438DRAFT_2075600 [Mycena galopus ATCC 62051]